MTAPPRLCEKCQVRIARKVRVRGAWHWLCTHCWRR